MLIFCQMQLTETLSYFAGCLFTWLFFFYTEAVYFHESHLSVFGFIFWLSWVLLRKSLLILYLEVFSLYFQVFHQDFDPFGVDFCEGFMLKRWFSLRLVDAFSFLTPFAEGAVFSPMFISCIFFFFSKIGWLQLCGLISGSSMITQQSTYLFWHKCHAVFMMVALQCNLESGMVMPSAWFFLLRFVLTIWGLCASTGNVRQLSVAVKNGVGILLGIALNL